MKTNKSLTKRIKVTKNGKLKVRKAGGNHFNAKESRGAQLKRKRPATLTISPKERSRFLPNT